MNPGDALLVAWFLWPTVCVLGAFLIGRRHANICSALAEDAARARDEAYDLWNDMCEARTGTDPTVQMPRVRFPPATIEDQYPTGEFRQAAKGKLVR